MRGRVRLDRSPAADRRPADAGAPVVAALPEGAAQVMGRRKPPVFIKRRFTGQPQGEEAAPQQSAGLVRKDLRPLPAAAVPAGPLELYE